MDWKTVAKEITDRRVAIGKVIGKLDLAAARDTMLDIMYIDKSRIVDSL